MCILVCTQCYIQPILQHCCWQLPFIIDGLFIYDKSLSIHFYTSYKVICFQFGINLIQQIDSTLFVGHRTSVVAKWLHLPPLKQRIMVRTRARISQFPGMCEIGGPFEVGKPREDTCSEVPNPRFVLWKIQAKLSHWERTPVPSSRTYICWTKIVQKCINF